MDSQDPSDAGVCRGSHHRTTDAIKAALPKKTTCHVDHRFVTFHGLNVTRTGRPTLLFRLHSKSI